ncbi:hypothetical protein ANN_00820 [Periplaneta americana]|uniref:DUF659 domain-containing protein n=1 Tax=Periplaneta americana TaxID=6978 RepID=A0ABQ8TTJ4_PERAM|nr:hypothetical protein ANN_00820 [Periplaneta americana]
MVHFTCLAHGLHRVAETVRGKFPEVNGLISVTRKVFSKSSCRMQSCMKLLPDVPLPPQAVITREERGQNWELL